MEIEGDKAFIFKLIPKSCFHEGQKFPYEVEQELVNSGFKVGERNGTLYYLVPEPGSGQTIPADALRKSQPVVDHTVLTDTVVTRYVEAAEQEVEPVKKTRRKAKAKPAAK